MPVGGEILVFLALLALSSGSYFFRTVYTFGQRCLKPTILLKLLPGHPTTMSYL